MEEVNSESEDIFPTPSKDFIKYRWCMLFCLSYVAFSEGTVLGITGPTLTEMTLKLQTTYEEISPAYSVKGIGMLVGAPLGGHVTDKFRGYFVPLMALSQSLMAVVMICIPFCTEVWMLGLLIVIQGFLFSTVLSALFTYALGLWKEMYAQIINFILMPVAIGKMVAAPISVPFLSSYDNQTEFIRGGKLHQDNSTEVGWKSSEDQDFYQGRVYYAFVINGAILFGSGLCLMVTYLIFYKKLPELLSYTEAPKEKQQSVDIPRWYRILVITLMFLFTMVSVIPQHGPADYTFSMAISDDVNFSTSEAGILHACLHIAAAVGRLVTGTVVRYCNTAAYLNAALVTVTVTGIFMVFYALYSKLLFWIFNLLFVFLFAPIISTGIAYLNYVIPATGLMIGLVQMGYGCGRLGVNTITGVVFQRFGSRAVFVEFTIAAGLCLFLSLVVITLYLCRKKKSSLDKSKHDDERHPLFRIPLK